MIKSGSKNRPNFWASFGMVRLTVFTTYLLYIMNYVLKLEKGQLYLQMKELADNEAR